jgi:LPLT family lysophospholipid transporter-like MFS transporter
LATNRRDLPSPRISDGLGPKRSDSCSRLVPHDRAFIPKAVTCHTMNKDQPTPAPRNYPLLLVGQFLGAFGDNFLLAAILGPLTYALGAGRITETVINGENALFGLVFSVPFILLAPLAGYLNDRMPKTFWLVGGNLIKLVGTGIGLAGVYSLTHHTSHAVQVVGYCVVGIGACFYSPAKYGILPEVVGNERLVKANGTVEMLTLVAIVAGLGGGGILYDHTLSLPVCYWASAALYAVALACNASMARTPCNPKASLLHSAGEFFSSFLILVRNPRLGRILLGSALFWFAGSTLKSALQGWGLGVFAQAGIDHVTNFKLVLLKIGMVVGIVSGAFMAGQLHKTGDLSCARRYAFILAAGLVGLGLLGGNFGLILVVLVLIVTGAAAGLLVVPFNAALQSETDPSRLGKTVSIQNCTDYIGIAAGAAYLAFLSRFDLSPNQDLIVLGITVAVITLGLGMLSRSRPARAA